MNSIKPHLMFLKHYYQYCMIFVLFFIGLQMGIILLQGAFTGEDIANQFMVYRSQLKMMGIFFPMIFSLSLSIKEFSGAMSIRADRTAFLKASIIFIIVFNFSILILVNLAEIVILITCNTDNFIAGNESEIVKLIIGDQGIIGSFLGLFISQISFSLIGFMFGAIFYRIDIKTSLILFIALPIVLVLYITRLSYINAPIIKVIGENVLLMVEYFLRNPIVFYFVELVVSTISISLAYLMLRNAPIKDYAHSKLKFRILGR